MKVPYAFIHSYRFRVTFILVLSISFVGIFSNYLLLKYSLDSQFEQLRQKLKVIAQTAALGIDADVLKKVPLTKTGTKSTAFKTVYEKLRAIKLANAPIKFIYTLTKTDQEGIWQFIVDTDALDDSVPGPHSYPGDLYDASRFPDMLKGYEGPSADHQLEEDEWGASLSGYAPIRDERGEAVAVLGVDLMADEVLFLRNKIRRRGMAISLGGIIFAVIVGSLMSRKITRPIEKLVDGTRRIAQGNLRHQVPIEGKDEVAELANSFNRMARKLFYEQKNTHTYFYRVMQSLIRMLEAKDVYTTGHSDRVSGWAEKIARQMGCSESEIEMVREAAQLHDIGKLSISKALLNKEGPLTDEEWNIIREHPIVGEEILRPVVLDLQILKMVRSHHERFDGSGYPDKIKGKDINLFAQIISVADAYDAMTSERPYRKAMSLEAAVQELYKNKGFQFHPKVVDAFVAVHHA